MRTQGMKKAFENLVLLLILAAILYMGLSPPFGEVTPKVLPQGNTGKCR